MATRKGLVLLATELIFHLVEADRKMQVTIWLGGQPSSGESDFVRIGVKVGCAPKSPQNAEQESPEELVEARGGETLQLGGVPGLQVVAGEGHRA